jgi:phage tail-like protein
MDSNQQRFWMIADEAQWELSPASDLVYHQNRRTLGLRSEKPSGLFSEDVDLLADAQSALEVIPQTRDATGARAFWTESERQIQTVSPNFPDPVPILSLGPDQTPTDLVAAYDDVLYVATAGAVLLQDRRDRWDDVTVRSESLSAWRLAADPSGGVWVMDRAGSRIGRLRGSPLPRQPEAEYAPDTFRPRPENPNPPRLVTVVEKAWPAGEIPAGLDCSPSGRLALLTWRPDGEGNARLRLLGVTGVVESALILNQARHPFSVAWVSETRVAVLLSELGEALVYDLPEAAASPLAGPPEFVAVDPAGDYFPLPGHDGGPFLHGLARPPHFPTERGSLPLHRLSLPQLAARAESNLTQPFDSAGTQTEWHRLYLEAILPPHCAVTVRLAATDDRRRPASEDASAWHEHRFDPDSGAVLANGETPRGVWLRTPSEIPHHSGLLPCPGQERRSGLFTALIQRSGRRVRTLRGRYLWLRAELSGNGRATPEIAALRVYGPRFSYLNHYLPELYRETEYGPEADEKGASTGPDFLERFLGLFEGVLTPLEDRIAQAHLLTDPRSTPDEALEWLGSWIGMAFDPAYPVSQRRTLVRLAPWLFRERGTLLGLKLALEIVTGGRLEQRLIDGRFLEVLGGGAVSGGEVVVLEDFRLRRTMATILGADLADEQDPLLGGLVASGNSFVGDTLILGEEERKEFLALFQAGLLEDSPSTSGEAAAVAALYDRLAQRATVLVHEEVEPQDLGLIRRVVELEAPAHIQTRVLTASWPFLVSIASLVNVDTYLGPKPPRQPVNVGRSRLGERDYLMGTASLDPRTEGVGMGRPTPAERPVARLAAPESAPFGESFILDGGDSRAASEHRILRYIWQRTL